MKILKKEALKWLSKAFCCAEKAGNKVHPNPYVGAVVVKNGKLVSTGYHQSFGGPHAEVNAIRKAGKETKGAELYVTLEPCTTLGKTPPCTDLIISSGIKKVYFAAMDPNPLHCNQCRGILEKSNVLVEHIPMEEREALLNASFRHGLWSDRPYVRVKIALTLDGKISDETEKSRWISSETSRHFVMTLRSQSDGILVGKHTFNMDNPSLSVRHLKLSDKTFKDPDKIIFWREGDLKYENNLLAQESEGRVLLFGYPDAFKKINQSIKNRRCVFQPIDRIQDNNGLFSCLKAIKALGVHNLLVEGGGVLISKLLEVKAVDELHIFMAPRLFGAKAKAGFSLERGFQHAGDPPEWNLINCRNFDNDVYMRWKHV